MEIIAADNFSSDLVAVDALAPLNGADGADKRQFGISLRDDERISIGVGPGDRPMKGMGAGYMEPTVRIAETTTITREGFELELAKASGETPDHLIVWHGAEKILFCGDNFYRAANLYAIRGTAYRDFDAWADTMDQLMSWG